MKITFSPFLYFDHHHTRSTELLKRGLLMMLTAIGLLLLSAKVFAAGGSGTDLLANADGDVEATFGQNSKLLHWIYIGEIIMAIIGYIKVRNPMIFAGLVLLLVFTHFGYTAIAA